MAFFIRHAGFYWQTQIISPSAWTMRPPALATQKQGYDFIRNFIDLHKKQQAPAPCKMPSEF
jgi:hypothetical protein